MEADFIVIGGGVVGLSVAFGLVQRNHRVLVLDGDDGDYRASRGNFGLVWVQGKGLSAPEYARWTRRSAELWRAFSQELEGESRENLCLSQNGGYDIHFTEETLSETVGKYEELKAKLGDDYPFEVLRANELKRYEPSIGPAVAGAILHHEDGQVNPLILLKALASAFTRNGGSLQAAVRVVSVETTPSGFRAKTANGASHTGGNVVMAAGLGGSALGPQLGFKAPLTPLRGQNLITEKLPRFMNRPSVIARQVNEGGVQIGDSKEPVGFDDRETLPTIARIAARAVKTYPILAKAKLVRSWGALRVMTPDGLPIYQQSTIAPGAFLVTCHSGITLAAVHKEILPLWLEGANDAPDLEVFSEDRF